MSFFDHFAESSSTPVGERVKRRERQRQFALMQPFFPNRDCTILEIGPGMGELSEIFLNAGYRNYTAVEPNDTMRNSLAARGVITKNYRIPHLQEEENAYDAIILFDVFEHLNDTHEATIFLAEARRVLRPGGLLCILAPDYLHWKEDFFNCDFSHANVTSVRRTLQLFYNNGFRMLTYAYFSGFFMRMPATVTSHMVRLAFAFSSSNGIDKKWYKFKLNFLRKFLIIGRKHTHS
jgi:SAM-dependent methyltransferase